MGLIATSRIKIDGSFRQPGYRLTEDDLAGRNVDAMKRHGQVKYVDDDEYDAPKRRGRRPVAEDE
jgi:hypothetical protein